MAAAPARAMSLVALLAALASVGCGPQTYNVRAARAYSNEIASLEIVQDRVVDLEQALELADRLLTQQPYAPGARWMQKLALDDDQADVLEDRVRAAKPYSEGDYEVPFAKLYATRVRAALDEARAGPAPANAQPSVLAAAAALAPGAKDLVAEWRAVVDARRRANDEQQRVDRLEWEARQRGVNVGLAPDPPDLAAARGSLAAAEQTARRAQQALRRSADALARAGAQRGDAKITAADALDALTFVERMHLEALAMAPYAVKQARRLGRDGDDVADLLARADRASRTLDEERGALDVLASALVGPAGKPLTDAAGFQMHEGLFEQAARVNFDASHLHVKGDAELLFFHEIASYNATGAQTDYTGRTHRLVYQVDPVLMLGGRVLIAYDFLHVKNAASLGAGFKTNRLFSTGGDVTTGNSLGQLVGLDGLASDFFDIGADLAGFNTSIRFATFTSGEVRDILVNGRTDDDIGVWQKAPFQLTYRQIDVGFDFTKLWPEEAEEASVEAALLGFRHMSYRIPRVFYELEEHAPGAGAPYVLVRESPPQSPESTFYMGGLALRLGTGDWHRVSPFADVGLYGGGGPIRYYFTPDPEKPGGTREVHDATMLAVSGDATLGVRFRLTSRRRPRIVTELAYHAEIVGQGIVSDIQGTRHGDTTSYTVSRKVDLGGFDLFHGPRLLGMVVF